MKTYSMLQRQGRKRPLPSHFEFVVSFIQSALRDLHPGVSEADRYASEYLDYNINRKAVAPFGKTIDSQALEEKTLTGFLQRELVNRKINETDSFGYNTFTGDYESDGDLGLELLLRARSIIAEILGVAPSVTEVARLGNFGSGASATLRRKDAARQAKFARSISATSGLARFVPQLVGSSPSWLTAHEGPKGDIMTVSPAGEVSILSEGNIRKVAGAILDYVPKDAEIHRIILKEPEFNGYLQKGLGKIFREKLSSFRGWGIRLNNSGDVNDKLAKEASVKGHLATVDAERASDSITLALCEFLLPQGWYDLCLLFRSPYVLIPRKGLHRLQMMAGMGNGFCFELESIIFYAIGLACAERSKLTFAELFVSIHGDDLIVPADVFTYVACAYQRAGIVINVKKSFSEGPFRESCGGHYYQGSSVKPFFRKGSNGYNRGDWFWLANSLMLWLADRDETFHETPSGVKLLQTLLHLRYYASSGEMVKWSVPHSRGRRGGLYSQERCSCSSWYKQRAVVAVPVTRRASDKDAYAAWLHTPVVSPTVLDLLYQEDLEADTYGINEETHERERWIRFSTWPSLPEAPSMSSLWMWLETHKT